MSPGPRIDGLFDLTGRIAVVTGAGRGLGADFARGLAAAGCTVVLTGRDRARLEPIAASIGPAHHAIALDVTDAEQITAAVGEIETTIGPIDILVNNAAVHARHPLTELGPQRWKNVVDTNLSGPYLVAAAVAPHMIGRGSGKIINIASIRADGARAGSAAYCASKAGLVMLTRAMCAEWAAHGLQINALAPGYVAQGMVDARLDHAEIISRTPAGRMATGRDLLGPLLYLASPAADFVNGHTLVVDGGYTALG